MSTPRPIPEGYHAITPYLTTADVAALIEFTKKAFEAEVNEMMQLPDGSIMHAEIQIRDSRIMLGMAREENPPMPGMFYLYVEDCDAAYDKALAAGGESIMEPADQFYGDRSGAVRDSEGNQWWFGTRVEEVPPEEAVKRMMGENKE
ncbi:MAG: VOC family protein [Verrucomicrobiota bacterium]